MPGSKKNSRSFSAILILLTLVLFANIGMFSILHIRYQDSYYAALADKIELLKITTSPRLIIVGGSNAAFGIDSAYIHQQTGMQVINMGLNGNLGMHFMLALIKPYLLPQDLVMIIPEYQLFTGDDTNIGPPFIQALIANPALSKYISTWDEFTALAKLFPYVYTSAIRSTWQDLRTRGCVFCENEEMIYYRGAFNEFGDVISHNNIHPTREIEHLKLSTHYTLQNTSKTISIINDFAQSAYEKDASVVLIYPATPTPAENTLTTQVLDNLHQQLVEELDIPILGTQQEAWYSRALFFDTEYHLIPEGRFTNTLRILNYVDDLIQKN